MARIRYRRIRKDQVVGDTTINDLFENDRALDNALAGKLDEAGEFRTREVPRIRGNYVLRLDRTAYELQRQTAGGYLPASIPNPDTGEIVLNFAQPLPEQTFDVHLTPGLDFDGWPGSIAYGENAASQKTPDYLLIRMRNGAATANESLKAFTLSIAFGD